MSAMLEIRPMVFDDIHEIMQWVNEPEVLATFANFKPISFEEEAAFLLQLLKSKQDFTYTIEYQGRYAGQVSLNKIYWAARHARLAIFIKKEFRAKGIGQEVIRLLLEKAFEEIKLHKVWLMVREDNLKARAFYAEAGFREEALLIDEYIDPQQGHFLNMLRMYCLSPKA